MSIEIIKAFSGQKPIVIYPVYLDITGDYATAAALGQVLYWHEVMRGKFYKTDSDFEQELHLTPKQFRRVKTELKSLPFLKITVEQIPAKTFYDVDYETLAALIGQIRTPPKGGTVPAPKGGTVPAQKGGTVPAQKGGTVPAQKGGTITENTTENKTENNNNNSEPTNLNNQDAIDKSLLSSLNVEKTTHPKKPTGEEKAERQKEKAKSVVLFPLVGLDEKQKAEASKKLAQLSQEQRDIAIEMFNNTTQQGRIKKSPMALLNQLVNMGLNNELEAPTAVFNPMSTQTTTNEIKTPVEPVISEEEAKARDMAQRIRIAKQYMEKNKEAMLNDFKRIGAAYIGGHGAFFEPELRAAGLFD